MAKAKAKSGSRARPQLTTRSVRSRVKKCSPRSSTRRGGVTKHKHVLSMLQTEGGATVAAIARATGWQTHSVRGFLAGVVKKKLGLNLTSEKTVSGRLYRLATAKPQPASRAEAREGPAHE